MDITHLVQPLKATALTLCIASSAVHAQSIYPIDISSELNGLELLVASSNIGNEVMVSVKNEDQVTAYCQATFNNGPQIPIERRAEIKPGKSTTITAPMMREVIRVNVTLNCDRQAD